MKKIQTTLIIIKKVMKFKLNTEDILNKKFAVTKKGYSMTEVDSFLDLVLDDYRAVEEISKKKDEEIDRLSKQIELLKKEVGDLKENQELKNLSFIKDGNINDYQSLDNLDLLKKCSKYEKKLFSLGINPSKIK